MNDQSDFDSPWKDVLDLFFEDAMKLFFASAHAQIDWSRGYEFLDKELQKITADAAIGRRVVDKLVKVWLKTGRELWVLLHIEVQGQRETDFELRVYIYNYRAFDRFNAPVATFAILTDEEKNWRPETHNLDLLGTELRFKFSLAKLADYEARWKELEQSANPFAVVVQAHLLAQRTRGDARGRFQQKFSLTKRLYERGFDKQTIIGLYHFLDWVMTLPPELSMEFDHHLSKYEEEKKMPYVTTIERRGIEKGIEKGMEKGRVEGATNLTLRQLRRRFGTLAEETQTRIQTLPLNSLEELGEALLDFSSVNDLQAWLDTHPGRLN